MLEMDVGQGSSVAPKMQENGDLDEVFLLSGSMQNASFFCYHGVDKIVRKQVWKKADMTADLSISLVGTKLQIQVIVKANAIFASV